MLDIKKILALAEIHNPRCISIYMPTTKRGMNVFNNEDQLKFKALIRQIEKEIGSRFKYQREVHDFLVPLYEMSMDSDFWRNQDEGLAVFYSHQGLHRFRIPVPVAKKYAVSHSFLLWPLLKVVPTEDQSFYLLALGLDKVHLYLANPFKMKKILKKKLNQVTHEQVVGGDYEENHLQFHSQKSGYNTAIFHGRGEGKDDVKDEILKYYRAVNDIVMILLIDKSIPLLLTGLDHLVGLYKMANKYPHTLDKHLPGNPDDREKQDLHNAACEVMQPIFNREITQKAEAINQYLGTDKAGTDIEHILPNAIAGRVDSLILNSRQEIWGIFDPAKGQVRQDPVPSMSNISLMNLAAIKTITNGGQVFISDGEYLPDNGTKLSALYRY